MSRGRAPPTNAGDALSVDAAAVARFRGDLSRLVDPDRAVLLVAVSGGGDSLALLLLAHAVLGDRCLAATVDHGLRPQAAAEARFVAALCADRGIAHAVLNGRVEPGGNLSARARDLRYRLLEAHRQATAADAVATAHHADDQVETMVMRLNRASGVAGLAGVRRRQQRVVRPLLGWRRVDLAALVASQGITAVDDPTNRDDRFDRARLRKRLEGVGWINPARWGASAEALADAEDSLLWSADRIVARRCIFGEDFASFAAEGIPFELRRRVVGRCIAYLRPRFAPRGDTLARAVRALDSGRTFTLAEVRCRVSRRANAPIWHFEPAPPRRLH